MIFIIKSFRTIVFIFIAISTPFRLIYPPAFFRCLSNSPCVQQDTWRNGYRNWFPKLRRRQSSGGCRFNTGMLNTCTRLWLTESEQATPVDSIKNVVRSSVKVPEFDKHLKKAGGHIGRNVMKITIKVWFLCLMAYQPL